MGEYMQRQTAMSAQVVLFCRYLRQAGFPLGPTEEMDALNALCTLPLQNQDNFRLVLRAMLPKSRPQQKKFDQLYQKYWDELTKAVDAKIKQEEEEVLEPRQEQQPKPQQPSLQALKDWLYNKQNDEDEEEELASFSTQEVISAKDFSAFGDEDLEEVTQLIAQIGRSLATRHNRRYKRAKWSPKLDLRRTVRLNMRRGGEMLHLAFQKKPIRKTKLLMFCDVSKSMDLYSRFLVQFMYAFQNVYQQIETFVFSTQLHRVTEQLKEEHFEETLSKLSEEVPDWSGGTRIGESLLQFVEVFAPKYLDGRTIVLIMSDGWDTGNIEALTESMKVLHQKATKVIWLNPLAGNPNFKPSVEGMQAALPYIDVFASAHSVDSLREVVKFFRKGRKIRQIPHS
ncbi:MAG TPA: VWA containing CoxE family protein [Microscillaceae bacterium]|nr:VWA containing CoxE family protein [Microscillaceae bacterium]